MKAKTVLIISVSVLLCAFICFLSVPRRVSLEKEGICWSAADDALDEAETLCIDGAVHRHLFKEKEFIGTVKVDGVEQVYTKDVPIFLHRDRGVLWGSLGFYDSDKNRITVYGTIFFGEGFDDIVIMRSDEETVFSFPADDRAQAVETANRTLGTLGFEY